MLSKEKRVKERDAWRELQVIIKGYRALGKHKKVVGEQVME